jgi:hypothetical protein
MTNKSSQGERPHVRYSGFERGGRLPSVPNREPEKPAPERQEKGGEQLASHIEEVTQDGAPAASPGGAVFEAGPAAAPPGAGPSSLAKRLAQRAAAALAKQAEARLHALRQLSRRMRPHDWRRRYLILLTSVHRQIFDRRIERLLFIKTVDAGSRSVPHPEDSSKKLFLYRGPISRKVLYWALSALPGGLKQYAFVDFQAGNGRTLLLAARLNFEHAAGYTYDPRSCEALEMNLAQYSRSYMSCREVRALRGDRDGFAIPSQPAVLFFPHSISANDLSVILSHISDAQRRKPQPLYLIFENSGREAKLDGMENFERVPLPILTMVKVFLFSPAAVAVYKSIDDGTGGELA